MIRKVTTALLLTVFFVITPVFYILPINKNNITIITPHNEREFNVQDIPVKSSPPITSPNIVTSYDIHYRIVSYGKIRDYNNGFQSISQTVDMLGMARFTNGVSYPLVTSYRIQALKNGTIFVYNLTNIIDGGYAQELGLLKGMNWVYVGKWNVDITNFEPQSIFQVSSGNYLIDLAGRNKIDNSIMIFHLQFNPISITFSYVLNISIPNPSLFTSINAMKIHWSLCFVSSFNISIYTVTGKYINGTENIPFAYRGYLNNGTFLADYTNLTTSTTNYKQFDEIIYSAQESRIYSNLYNGVWLISNKHAFFVGDTSGSIYPGKKILTNFTIPEIPILPGLYIKFSTTTASLNFVSNDYITWNWFDGITIEGYLISVFPGAYSYPTNYTVQERTTPSLLSQVIEEDMIINAMTDILDGMIMLGQDKSSFQVWQDWVLSSGSIGGIFDVYIPYNLISYQISSSSYYSFEMWYGDSRGIWYVQFNNNDTGIINAGISSVIKSVSQRVDITHSRGTNIFRYSVSGYIERSSNETVEIGIIPIYAQPTDVFGGEREMFSVNTINIFDNKANGGIILRPVTNFQGTGSTIMDFRVVFDADYCPFVKNFFGVDFVAMNVFYVVYERYSNGTFSQKLLRDAFTAKAVFVMFNYGLETSMVIQDSHMLDELHVIVDGIEFSPYDIVFIQPIVTFTVVDKITNETLYNGTATFADPLVVPIPAKYEFDIRYFSNFDRFGFDFSLLNTFVNGTQVSVESVRILSPNAEIVVTDFSGSVVRNLTINKTLNGTYVNIGLDVVQVVFMNKYNFTIDLYLERESTSIFYQLPSSTALILRLALGTYNYRVTDVNGTELIDETFDLTAAFGVTIGSTVLTFGEPTPIIAGLTLDEIIAILIITGMLIIILITVSTLISKQRQKSPSSSIYGNKPKPKRNRSNSGYLGI